MDVWEEVLLSNDHVEATRLNDAVNELRIEGEVPDWQQIAKVIGYPRVNIIHPVGFVNGHFLRALNEIKLLSIFGGHTWGAYHRRKSETY